MICKNIKTGKLYNYLFNKQNKVEIDNGNGWHMGIDYEDWCKDFYIVDKWRNLTQNDIEYNNSL